MRKTLLTIVLTLSVYMSGRGQDGSPEPLLSNDALSSEQIAVYRAVLDDYTKGTDGRLNLSDRTEPLDSSGLSFDQRCMRGMTKPDADSLPTIHRVAPSISLGSKLVLVDLYQQQKKVEENDPQQLIKSAINDHVQVTDKALDDSVKRAFETGVFQLSEILFDKEHRHALVAYAFACGMLCGNGNTLLLRKAGARWKIIRRCGGWVS